MKKFALRLFASFDLWYWKLDDRVRHIVGWTLVILTLVISVSCTWLIGREVYRTGVWVVQGIGQWISPDESETSANETNDETTLEWYAGNYKHRKFRCGALNKKRRVNVWRDFRDVNEVQLVAARRLGVAPVASRDDLAKRKGRLIHLKPTRFYDIDQMTHSVPYLVPDAADFLTALGERWQEYHGTESRFIITSCLRTERDVRRLRRGNVNATKESCHRYGTTFDITYNRFERHGRVSYSKLRADLARALYDMREAGHCYVKYEYQQACFHVTVRPR